MSMPDGGVHLAWKGVEGDPGLWRAQLGGTAAWSAPRRCDGTFQGANGLAVAGPGDGYLYLAWARPGADQQIWWSRLGAEGGAWATQAEVPGARSSTGPAMACWAGTPHLAWKGVDGDQGIWWSAFEHGRWATPQPVPGASSSFGPALATQHVGAAGQLVMAWKGVTGDDQVWWARYLGSGRWSTPAAIEPLGRSCGGGVALAGPRRGGLHLAWKAAGDGTQVHWSQLVGEHTWAPPEAVPGAHTAVGPALAVDGPGTACLAWRGSGDDHVWWARLEGERHWTAPARIPGARTSFRPALTTLGS